MSVDDFQGSELVAPADAEGGERGGAPSPPTPRPGRRRWLRKALLIFAVALAAVLVYGVVAFVQVWHATGQDEARSVDAIVVLGAAQYHGRPSPVLERRLLHALELYRAGHARIVVTTGSKRPGDRVTEGYAGYDFLLRRGVPDEDLLVVVHGADTWEEMTATAHVLSQRDLSTVLLVSDPYHSYRAKRSAEEAGLTAYASPTDGAVSFERLAREAAAVALGRIIGFRRVSRLR